MADLEQPTSRKDTDQNRRLYGAEYRLIYGTAEFDGLSGDYPIFGALFYEEAPKSYTFLIRLVPNNRSRRGIAGLSWIRSP